MRILLAFALVAAVAATPMPEPVQLDAAPEPVFVPEAGQYQKASMLPLYVPEALVKQFELNAIDNEDVVPEPVQFVNSADYVHPMAYAAFDELPAEVPHEEVIPSAINLVEAPEDSEVAAVPMIPSPVNLAQVADEIPAIISEFYVIPINLIDIAEVEEVPAEEVIPSAISFVEAPEESEVSAEPSLVNIAQVADIAEDAEVAEEIAPSAVNFAEAPENLEVAEVEVAAEKMQPSPINVFAPYDAEETRPSAVQFIDIPVEAAVHAADEIPAPITLEQEPMLIDAIPRYNDPMLR